MRKEKGGKRGRKKMDEREKESQVEERSEVITEEGTERREEEEIQEDPAIGEAVAEVSTTGPEERLSGQKYLQNSSSSPLM